MSISNILLAQLSSELGVQIVAQDLYILAAMLVIIVLTSRIVVDTMNAFSELIRQIAESVKKSRAKKHKTLIIKNELARNERDRMIQ